MSKKGNLLRNSIIISIAIITFSGIIMCRNPLNGKHLNVIWLRRGGVFNESYLGPKKGGIMLEYVANRFNFSYTFLNVSEITIEAPSKNKKGLVDYILNGQCDLIVHDTVLTFSRYQLMELIPWLVTSVDFLIPTPDSSANVDAVMKPFQYPVWISLLISIVLVSFTLKFTLKFTEVVIPLADSSSGSFRNSKSVYLYTVGLLVSQGGRCTWNDVASRFLTGIWCISAFVIVQAYTSTLITYIITPTNFPLIDTAYDIAANPDIKILFEKDRAFDRLVSNSQENSGIFKKLRDRLNFYPGSRCENMDACVKLVQDGGKNVFGNAYEYHIDAIINNYNDRKQCDLQIAKEGFFRFMSSWALPKSTPFRAEFTTGILEMEEKGLIRYWDQWFRRIPAQCIENTRKVIHKQPRVKNPRLSLKKLTGAFMIILVGYVLALFSFFVEVIGKFRSTRLLICRKN